MQEFNGAGTGKKKMAACISVMVSVLPRQEKTTPIRRTVGRSRGPNKANRNIVRQITKFGLIVYCRILINI